MALEFLSIFVVIAVLGLPGILFSFALLRGLKLNLPDKVILGLLFGFLLNPFMGWVESVLFGQLYTSVVILGNALLISIISLVAMYYQKSLSISPSGFIRYFTPSFYKEEIEKRPVAVAIYAILLILMLMGFYARFATAWAPNFFEFDPYYYDEVTQFLVQKGDAPLVSDMVYYPRFRSFRELPMIHYMTGGWYLLFRDFNSLQFDQQQMVSIIQFYPPLMGAFMIFLAFLFIREESNKYLGLIAAAMFCLTPQLIKKMGAGVSEQAPFGMFAAMLVFAMFALAVNRKSYRLGVLAALGMMFAFLGSAHYIWPIMAVAAFIFISSVLDYYTVGFNKRDLGINMMLAAAALIGNILWMLYKEIPLSFSNITLGVLVLLSSILPSIIFFAIGKLHIEAKYSKKQILAGLFILLFAFSIVTPVLPRMLDIFNSLAGYAKLGAPLSKTIQEENATSEGLFVSSFGALNPYQLLIGSTILLILLAVLALRKKGLWAAGGFGAANFIIIALNPQVDAVLSAIGDAAATSVPELTRFLRFFIDSDVFIYFLVSMVSVSVLYLYSDKKSKTTLLLLLAFFPIAYIGLNKVKYLLHLSFALALAFPFALMLFAELIERINSEFKLVASENSLKMGLLVLLLLIGTVVAYKQYETVSQSMAELQYSRITSDWIDATYWMRTNLTSDDRIISWWDYGHWNTFLGNTKSVLDPSNYFEDYDQLTARGFVEGNTSLLIRIMKYHQATHILVDSELVQKWGALVYLSGTFKTLYDDPQFAREPPIPSTSSPGSSQYETEHYFEYIYSVLTLQADGTYQKTQCPGVIPKQMLYSSFGAAYCIDSAGNMFLLQSSGEQKQLKDPRLIRADDSQLAPAPLGNNLYYNSRFSFINLNPDLDTLSDGKLKSNLYSAAFVNLFFLEKLDGFEPAYKSPNGQVKIFKLVA
ncbi:MAG: STT3 domain-containing protein [Candidatus Micrarchaeota archaeon]